MFMVSPGGTAPHAAEGGNQNLEGIGFNIRYFDKRIYHASGNQGEPIYVQATITNNSPRAYRFKLAHERAFSIDFDVRTLTNRPVEPADILIRRRTTSSRIFFREIAVESGESFSFIEDLRNYADLRDPGAFVVSARIYPELFQPEALSGPRDPASAQAPAQAGTQGSAWSPVEVAATGRPGPALESNRLSLTLRPPVIAGPGGAPLPLDMELGAVLSRERLAPDEVIEYLLTARQKSQWEKFFLYLDLEAIIARDPARRRQWNAEGEEGRQRMLTRYQEELRQSVIDGDITAIPVEFEIERTTYNAHEGTVVVLEKFRTGTNYTERKRYTYYMQRKSSYWAVIDYVVTNLGTE
jgi:hypothetical protein